MAMTGDLEGEVYWGPKKHTPSDERLAQAGLVKGSCEEAVGMTAKELITMAEANRKGDLFSAGPEAMATINRAEKS